MNKTKRSKRLLYSTFRGTIATQYGNDKEETARQKYVEHQRLNGHPNLAIERTGLVVSEESPWLAARPDDRMTDTATAPQLGLAQSIKTLIWHVASVLHKPVRRYLTFA